MKVTLSIAASLIVLLTANALAQPGAPSGRGAISGDPAASSTAPSKDPQGTSGMAPGSSSGSGSSTSGGKDDNGDQGRDKMPESNKDVRPHEQQPKNHP